MKDQRTPPTPAPSRRQLAKARTRARLLDAARAMFADRGYEAATVRDIAAAAGLSTGAVFASFDDKADLFGQVILDDYERLTAGLAAAAEAPGPMREALGRLFDLAYEQHLGQLRLVQAELSFSWLRDVRAARGDGLVLAQIARVLQRGADAGELARGFDVRLGAEMLWDAYLANYRCAIFDGWDRAALMRRLERQIDVILCMERKAA